VKLGLDFNFSSPISFFAILGTHSRSFSFFIFLSNSRCEGKNDEEAGRKEESGAATRDKAKAYEEENEKRACTDTFIPVSITALAGVDSFLMLTCATCIYSRSGRLLPAKRGHGQEISREVPSRVSRCDINHEKVDNLSWNLYTEKNRLTNKTYMIKGILVKPSRISSYHDKTRFFITRTFNRLYYKNMISIF